MTDTLTEFTWVEPDEVHLVGAAANGFPAPLLAKATEALDDVLDNMTFSDDRAVKYVSAQARRKYAKTGVAMPNGDFPIPDEGHLRSAVGRLGNYKGDAAKAKAHIIKRAKALGATHLLPEDWHVSKTADAEDAEKETAPDKAVPRSEAESQTDEVSEDVAEGCDPDNEDGGESHESGWTADMHTGQGTTADDKAVPRAEADSQTPGAQKDTGTGRGDTAPDGEAEARSAETESESQTDEVEKADAPGSPAWEHKDVALGEKAEELVSQLAGVVHTFTEREKAEGGASKELRRAAKAARSLLKNPDRLRKVAEQMTDTSELVKVLGEYDEARRAEKKAQKEAKAAKAAKQEKKAAKAAEKAAEATDDSEQNPELAKARAEMTALQERVAKMESADAKRIVTDPSALVTALRGGPESAANVFKQKEDDLAAAREVWEKNPSRTNEARMQQAGTRLAKAKLIAQDSARTEDPRYVSASLRGQGFPLFTNSQSYTDPQVEDRR